MATAAAAIGAHAERQVRRHFFASDAVHADRAVAFMPSSTDEARQFERMLERGIIKRSGTDKYWIDVVAYDIAVHRQHRQVKLALILLSVILAVALVATAFSSVHTVALKIIRSETVAPVDHLV